jgi:hypothetical protein
MDLRELLKIFQIAQDDFDRSEAAIYDEIQSRKVRERKQNLELFWKRKDEAKKAPWSIPVYLSSGVYGEATLGTVMVNKRNQALKTAQQVGSEFQADRLVLWADVSWKRRGCAAAVVYQNEQDQWISWTKSYNPRTTTSPQAETLAIEQAISIGFEYISEKRAEDSTLDGLKQMLIFTDSQAAMRAICDLYPETVTPQTWDNVFFRT